MAGLLPVDCDSRLRDLYDYWVSIRPADSRLPGRQHFDPIDIPRLLPSLWLLDVLRDPLRFRYRLISAAHVAITGKDNTGVWYDEAHPAYQSSPVFPLLRATATEGRPTFRRGEPTLHIDKDYIQLESLFLPLAHDGEAVDIVVAGTIYIRQSQQPALQPVESGLISSRVR